MISGSCSKSQIDLLNDLRSSCSCCSRSLSGVIVIEMVEDGERRRMISVANRVHKFSFLGNGICVMASKTLDFPED